MKWQSWKVKFDSDNLALKPHFEENSLFSEITAGIYFYLRGESKAVCREPMHFLINELGHF